MSQATDIDNRARLIQREYPRLNSGANLDKTMRLRLVELATYCGMSPSVADGATAADLISVYRVALKDTDAAIRTATRIQARFAGSSVFDDPKPRPDPNGAPYGEPASPSPSPGSLDLDAIRDHIDERIFSARAASREYTDKVLNKVSNDLLTQTLEVGEALNKALPGLIAAGIKSHMPTTLNVSLNAAPVTALGLVHKDTQKLIMALAAGCNVYLHGPAGSGKTTGAHKAATAFGLQFYFAAKVESEYQLLGFTDAKGDAVRTQFREAYEHGGVFLFDEMDASSAASVVALNAALANGICPFPDAIVPRHPDFHVIGAGNTKLTGANAAYAGRNKLDAASIDRFVFMEWGYDDTLERALATDAAWCEYVQAVRKKVADRGLNHLVTPRATYDGCKLLAAGFEWDEAADMCIFKGLDPSTVAQVR